MAIIAVLSQCPNCKAVQAKQLSSKNFEPQNIEISYCRKCSKESFGVMQSHLMHHYKILEFPEAATEEFINGTIQLYLAYSEPEKLNGNALLHDLTHQHGKLNKERTVIICQEYFKQGFNIANLMRAINQYFGTKAILVSQPPGEFRLSFDVLDWESGLLESFIIDLK